MTHIKSHKAFDQEIEKGIVSEFTYSEITNQVQVTVVPEFVDSKSMGEENFVWAYHIRVDNYRNESIKLISRFWRIVDESGHIQEVSGDGVVGEQPTILPHSSYQYSSGVHLRYSSGIMSGYYKMQQQNGEGFVVKIPSFSLDVPALEKIIN